MRGSSLWQSLSCSPACEVAEPCRTARSSETTKVCKLRSQFQFGSGVRRQAAASGADGNSNVCCGSGRNNVSAVCCGDVVDRRYARDREWNERWGL
jgi:hypothetical protein